MTAELTSDLRRLVTTAEGDLRERSERSDLAWARDLRAEYEAAFAAGRTALSWSEWRDGEIAQDAVAWVLATVFVRFCEDNDLIARRWIAGPGDGTRLAVDAEAAFYAADPRRATSDWLRDAFGHLAELPATGAIVDREHSPVWTTPLGDDVCRALLLYWRQADADGQPLHSLGSYTWDTRFLGDLYQDLSELAKKKYALLQTPDFVEEFILDRTLTPALSEFPLEGFRLIDPTCGSGHFLLGAFQRLLAQWQQREPGASAAEHVRHALDSVFGVDLNPFAAAIARFRLAVAALHASGFRRLTDAPQWSIHVAVGDSLLGGIDQGTLIDDSGAAGFRYRQEDLTEHPGILTPGTYHAVVGNPPYITVKDKALNALYRAGYPTCSGKYALSVPFMELFFRLAVAGHSEQPGGFVGQITSNSFMKREFGKKPIEEFLSGRDPRTQVDLLDVIDTSGAYIPGHSTPTVILIGRRRRLATATVRAVLGARGEPGQPPDPALGLVWTEIARHLDDPGFEGAYVSVADLDRGTLSKYPWSLSGGGASDVKEAIESGNGGLLGESVDSIGFGAITGDDEVFVGGRTTPRSWRRHRMPVRPFVEGDRVRDFTVTQPAQAAFPYSATEPADSLTALALWPWRTTLRSGLAFGKTREDKGAKWWEYILPNAERLNADRLIAFAFVATHNHFVLDRGGKVFNRSAPVIKLPADASEDDHLALLGVLNSSTVCFWLKQVSHSKGNATASSGMPDQPWSWNWEFTGTKLKELPLPSELPLRYGALLDELAVRLTLVTPAEICSQSSPNPKTLTEAATEFTSLRRQMIAVQEELDWHVYSLYGLIDEDLTISDLDNVPGIQQGERAFEYILARQVAAGESSTRWFSHHRSYPRTTLPDHWPAEYRDLVQRRVDAIESNPSIRLLERPEFKRRWASESWEVMQQRAVTDWILDRLEAPDLWQDPAGPRIQSVAQLAAHLRHDPDLIEAARVLTGVQDPDLAAVLAPLVADQAVPYLAAYRYKDSGLRRRGEWEHVWDLQRREDAGEKVSIPVPPKYAQADFAKQTYWAARGKLDVPKERFISYPGCESGADTSLVVERVREEGWGPEQITPVLAGLVELEPWLHQWHHQTPPGMPTSPATAITAMIDQRLQTIDATRDQVRAWRPPAPTRGRRKKQGASNA